MSSDCEGRTQEDIGKDIEEWRARAGLYSSIGAIPFATMSNREWGQIGSNYLRGLFALAFQGFFIMVCVGIYSVLVANIQVSDNVHTALLSVMAYTVVLCFSLMKTANFSKSIFNAH